VGSGDDLIANAIIPITAKDMVVMSGTARQHFWGIEYHFESPLLSDGEASYKVYFEVDRI
jgi:hypothetical protein